MHPTYDLDYFQLFQNFMHFELSAIALSILDQTIVDPCSQSLKKNMSSMLRHLKSHRKHFNQMQ